jgi:hypothetical protein
MAGQPTVVLFAYRSSNGFTTFIVSGGGIEFMRTFGAQVFEIQQWTSH